MPATQANHRALTVQIKLTLNSSSSQESDFQGFLFFCTITRGYYVGYNISQKQVIGSLFLRIATRRYSLCSSFKYHLACTSLILEKNIHSIKNFSQTPEQIIHTQDVVEALVSHQVGNSSWSLKTMSSHK